MKYYAIKKGHQTGIFNSWDECKKNVHGYSGAIYKSFGSLEAANLFLHDEPKQIATGSMLAYVDGSYNVKTNIYGYGVVILNHGEVEKKWYGSGQDLEMAKMRNVSGEILGTLAAVEYAIEKGEPSICIYYDYEGIEKWALKQWQANKPGTILYVSKMQEYQKNIVIEFVKVLAHSGNLYNDMADMLAKSAVGIGL